MFFALRAGYAVGLAVRPGQVPGTKCFEGIPT